MNRAQIHQQHPNIRVKPFWLKRWVEDISNTQWHKTFGIVFELVKSGKLTIQAPRTRFSLREYEKAINEAQQSGHIGKVIFEPFLLR